MTENGKQKMPVGQRKEKLVRQTGVLGNVLSTGLTGGICVAIGLFAGLKVDAYFQVAPYGVMGGILFGLAAAGVQTYKQLKESMGAFRNERDRAENKTSQM